MKTITETDAKTDLLKIITFPDHLLTQKSERVEKITQHIRDLSAEMIKAMIAAPGQGLAAVQVGVLKRIIVMDYKREDDNVDLDPLVMINPEIIDSDEVEIDEEGCLSIPDIYADLPRPYHVTVSFTDLNDEDQTIELRGVAARCLLHELDHLDGILFWDRLSKGRRLWLKVKFYKKFGPQ